MVNVQDKEEFSSYTLNRDIWADKRIASVIRLNYVLIQIDRDSSEGRDFGRIYNVPAYPHVSIVDGLTGECMWSRSVSNDHPLETNDFLKTRKKYQHRAYSISMIPLSLSHFNSPDVCL